MNRNSSKRNQVGPAEDHHNNTDDANMVNLEEFNEGNLENISFLKLCKNKCADLLKDNCLSQPGNYFFQVYFRLYFCVFLNIKKKLNIAKI